MTNANPAADLSRVVLRLRDDLTFTPQVAGGERLYVVEDRLSGKCYRVGAKEYEVAKALDGRTSLAEVSSRLHQAAGETAFTEAEVLQVSRWLLLAGLVQLQTEPGHYEAQGAPPRAPSLGRAALWNPIFIRIPLLSPDRLLDKLTPCLGWINSRSALIVTALLWIVAAVHLASGWSRFASSAGRVFSLDQGFYLLLGWIALKVLHEFGHGLACKHYGSFVREGGVALLLLAPIPYVDVTSSWRLRSKWARIHIAAAGMMIEATVGSLAVLVWSYSPDGVLASLCVSVIVMATATTVLFNANPLMRFDGYYILTDWLELPNLYSRGQQYVSSWTRRVLRGNASEPLVPTPRIVRLYGLAAYCWRMIVCVSLILGAAALFHGAGVIIAAIAVFSWYVVPMYRTLQSLWAESDWKKQMRPFAILTSVAVLGSALLYYTPWPFPTQSPGIVEYEPLSIARAQSSGFVREILVVPGQQVSAGQLLARLDNPELANQLELLRISIEEAELRCRIHRQRGEMAAHQAQTEQLAALHKQRSEKQEQVAGLSIHAPVGGYVVGRALPHLLGTYLSEGDELCRLGDESAKELQLSIHQDDVDSFQQQVGRPLAIRGPHGLMHAPLTRISPRASERASHLALCASYGGPLPVRQATDGGSSDEVELLEPRFVGHVTLPPDASRQLLAGQLCTALVRAPRDSVGAVLARHVRDWVSSKTAAN